MKEPLVSLTRLLQLTGYLMVCVACLSASHRSLAAPLESGLKAAVYEIQDQWTSSARASELLAPDQQFEIKLDPVR